MSRTLSSYLTAAGLAAILSLVSMPVAAQYAGAFNRVGFGARGMALGNALVADASGDAGIFYNPALAPYIGRQHIEASAALMRFNRQLQFLQLAAPLRPRAGIAAGLIHAAVTDIDGRDNSGFHTENLSTDEFAFFVGFGVKVSPRVAIGINLQLYRSDLLQTVDPVNSIGLDAGVAVALTETIHLGAVVDDLLAKYDWDTSGAFGAGGKTTRDRFPRRIRLGGMYRMPDQGLRLYGEYEILFAKTDFRTVDVRLVGGVPTQVIFENDVRVSTSYIRFGGEYDIVDSFVLRGGVSQVLDDALAGVRPTVGFMVDQPVGGLGAQFEYAFVLEPYASGTMHVLSVRLFL